MKKLLLSLCTIAVFISCDGGAQKQTSNENANKKIDMNVKDKSFDELFEQVKEADVKETLAGLMVQEEHTVLTAGTESKFNSMPASWEALGRYFQKPGTLCLLGANRYTLEFIRQQKSYTMSFLPEQFRSDVMALGRQSGRDSDKMKETRLTYAKTPSGNITYKEARVVIECQLFEITTVHPEDFYTEDGRKFVEDALNEASDYHKLVFGTITHVWVRK